MAWAWPWSSKPKSYNCVEYRACYAGTPVYWQEKPGPRPVFKTGNATKWAGATTQQDVIDPGSSHLPHGSIPDTQLQMTWVRQ
ncbi:hypothetical protein DSLASN_24490 [Desulfoluna limicola]|uniref:DUF397 domain-containing protein n=1 Tax=Desulfoluna limicola TaxID=2810562 RepID=A0ABM7PHI7_9BACT|nr:hypothetical protein DSLASN_24490 [Desulfoluna limicola]